MIQTQKNIAFLKKPSYSISMHLNSRSKLDIAEDIVSKWQSLTRDISWNNKCVMRLLRNLISQELMSNKVEEEVANNLSLKVITTWVTECEGVEEGSQVIFDVLTKKIEDVLV